jgi:hypothetical protein
MVQTTTANEFEKLPQFVQGKNVEAYLDEIFRRKGFQIRQTTQEEERKLCLGDRQFSKNGCTFFVEYKSGLQTHYTHNVFIETISVDDPDHFRSGWLFTCMAKYIIYATILDGCLLVFRPSDLRNSIDIFRSRFKEVPTSNHQNKGYNTHGFLVPFDWAKKNLVYQVIQLNGYKD